MASPATIHQLHKGQQAMPSKNGFITVWRDIQKQPWYKSPEHLAIFMHILTSATHQHRSVDFKGVPVSLLPGQFITTYKKLAETFGIESESKVRRIVNKFIKLDQITKANLKKGRTDIGLILTINNWEKWQKTDTPTDTPSDTPSDTPKVAYIKGAKGSADTHTDTPSDTLNNNDINNKKDKRVSLEQAQDTPSQKPVSQEKKNTNSKEHQVVDLYNQILANKENRYSLPSVKVLTDKRKRTIAKLLKIVERDTSKIERYFQWVLDNAESHKWLFGENQRGWVANIEFICRDETFAKATENLLNDWEASK